MVAWKNGAWAVGLALAVGFGGAGCSDAAKVEVSIVMFTDLLPGVEFDQVRVRVGEGDSEPDPDSEGEQAAGER